MKEINEKINEFKKLIIRNINNLSDKETLLDFIHNNIIKINKKTEIPPLEFIDKKAKEKKEILTSILSSFSILDTNQMIKIDEILHVNSEMVDESTDDVWSSVNLISSEVKLESNESDLNIELQKIRNENPQLFDKNIKINDEFIITTKKLLGKISNKKLFEKLIVMILENQAFSVKKSNKKQIVNLNIENQKTNANIKGHINIKYLTNNISMNIKINSRNRKNIERIFSLSNNIENSFQMVVS